MSSHWLKIGPKKRKEKEMRIKYLTVKWLERINYICFVRRWRYKRHTITYHDCKQTHWFTLIISGTGKPVMHRHVSSIFATSQLIRQMCSRLPISASLHTSQKPHQVSVKFYIDFYVFLHFPHPFPMRCTQNAHSPASNIWNTPPGM